MTFRFEPMASHLETKFLFRWRLSGGPTLVREHRFCERRWRFDFAHTASKTAIEIEGGAYTKGRHTRPMGFLGDCEKYLEASLLGWRVYRLSAPLITMENCERIAKAMGAGMKAEMRMV
jgi:hypothetical protein